MTITRHAGLLLNGLSSDTKPTTNILAGTRFVETDTTNQFTFDGVSWKLTSIGKPSARKLGTWQGMSGTVGDGLFVRNFIAVGASATDGAASLTDGRYIRYTSAGGSGDNAGPRYAVATVMRGWNPRLKFRFRVNHTDNRVWLGIRGSAGTDPTGDDEFNATIGFCLGMIGTDTVWQVVRNDGTGSTVFSNVTGNPAVDTNIHTCEIVGDDANSRWGLSFDGGAFTYYTTDIPLQTAFCALIFQIEATTAAARTLDLFYIELEQDK